MDTGCRMWRLGGFLFTAAAGTLLHFAYGWSGENPVVGAFSAVNESTWEHMKLLFVPLLLTALAAAALGGRCRGTWTARLAGALAGLLLIPLLYYGYTGALGLHVVWVDMAIFYAAAGAAFLLEGHIARHLPGRGGLRQAVAAVLFAALAVLFVWWTYAPPHLPLFMDPVTGQYGI
mgnify:CR=1 FL=1